MNKTKDFDYHLPGELIAQLPSKPRDHSRLLLLNKVSGTRTHSRFFNLVDYLQPGDLLILNNSQVFPARLQGRKKKTGGRIEVFLHRPVVGSQELGNIWECLIKGHILENSVIEFFTDQKLSSLPVLIAEIIKNNHDGTWQLKFNAGLQKFWRLVNQIGEVPLPPYIKRNSRLSGDSRDYQTVFADAHKKGSVAAPTAGLHFTKNLLKKIKERGVNIEYVTLHVGLGTFAPVKTENIQEHRMHQEFAEVKARVIKDILQTKKKGGRIIAVGTTTCRTLESLDWGKLKTSRLIKTQAFWTDIFIYPGYRFKVIDALITNFHLPKSTLLMLVSALAGRKNIILAYQEAIAKEYRFFSYGDAMFIY